MQIDPVFGMWINFWYGNALLNSPSDGLNKKEIQFIEPQQYLEISANMLGMPRGYCIQLK